MNVFTLFLILAKASFLSFGGLGGLPLLHEDLVGHGATEAMFGQALAVGRLSPGPNGLYVVSLAYQIAGLPGAAAAAVAVLLPPLTIVVIAASYSRVAHLPRANAALRWLSLAVAGLLGWTSWQIAAGSAATAVEWGASAAALVLVGRLNWHPLSIIAAAAAAGILLYR
ncbi:MAG: chromate transporter [Chloroflexota bacterium]|nr:chromate transporter [Chloroflexota bacterium]